jgi:hypothetical protein
MRATGTARVILGAAAAAMTVVTIVLLVLLPSGTEAFERKPADFISPCTRF